MAASRNPPVLNFDYTARPKVDADISEGLGLSLAEYESLKPQFWEVFQAVNPDLLKYQSVEARKIKANHIAQFYAAFPTMCEVPDTWRDLAISKIFTDTRSRNSRPAKPTSKRKHSPAHDREESQESGRLSKRSRSLTVPIFTAPTPSQANTTTLHYVLFRSQTGDVIHELLASTLIDRNGQLSWADIVGEAEAYRDDVQFPFDRQLFLVDRSKQHLPIRTHLALQSALHDLGPALIATFVATCPGNYTLPAQLPHADGDIEVDETPDWGDLPAQSTLGATPEHLNDSHASTEWQDQPAACAPLLQQNSAAAEPLNCSPASTKWIVQMLAKIQPVTVPAPSLTHETEAKTPPNADTTRSLARSMRRKRYCVIDEDDDDDDTTNDKSESNNEESETGDGEEQGQDQDEEDSSEDEEDPVALAARIANEQSATKTANTIAQRATVEDWDIAARVWGLDLRRLMLPADQRFVNLPLAVGLRSSYRSFPFQVVGATHCFLTAFGEKKGGILGDDMGMGKTHQILCANHINYCGVMRGHGIYMEEFPTLDVNGCVEGVVPRSGALFLSASPQGLEAWPEVFSKMYRGSKFTSGSQLAKEWRIKMVILHGNGEKICERYGGVAAGLYSRMTTEEWAEILPQPDWSKARLQYGNVGDVSSLNWTSTSSWPVNPHATTSQPAPSSVRYIIVSTNQSWRTHVSCSWSEQGVEANDTIFKTLVKQAKDIPLRHRAKSVQAELKLSEYKAAWVLKSSGKKDGHGLMQARRDAQLLGSGKKGPTNVTMVVDLHYASWLVIDELHAAAAKSTLTYTQVIGPALFGRNRARDRPGVMGVTGSALANGIQTVLTFALDALRYEDCGKCIEPGVRILAEVDSKAHNAAWQKMIKLMKSKLPAGTGKRRKYSHDEMARHLLSDPQIASLFKLFATIVETYFIARDYESRDPWDRKLNLVDAKHTVKTLKLEYAPDQHAKLKAVEDSIQSSVTAAWKERVQEWEDDGQRGPRPNKPMMSAADPTAYHTARILAIIPNLLDAIRAWQQSVPGRTHIIGAECTWGESIGGNNEVLAAALASTKSIRESFVWEIAKDACLGSKKVDHILETIHKISNQSSIAKHSDATRAARGDTEKYRSKYVLISNLRLARAIVWCRIVQTFGEESTVMVSNATDRLTKIPEWQKVYKNPPCFIMVAGLKVICQSVNLVEGHVLEGLEPHANNAEAVQAGNRQYRIGQLAPEVFVNWLVHSNSVVEQNIVARNASKNRFVRSIQAQVVQTADLIEMEDDFDMEI